MKISKFTFLIMGILLVSSCKNADNSSSSNQNKEGEEQVEAPKESVQEKKASCTYVVDEDKTKVIWTAYKTTDKVPVRGTFDNIIYKTSADTFSRMEDAMRNTTFLISPESVNSGNKIRDPKLVKFFFKNLGMINGKFAAVQENGTGLVQLLWAGLNLTQPYSYHTEGDTLWITTKIDFKQWKLEKAAAALNKACKVLHTGKDGKSKLWPEVDVNTKVVFKKYCN